jgi:predicted ATPase/DNA-binding SARP family transcriptional activator/class 3 adenylate cyclase
MEFRVLGPLEVIRDGRRVALGGAKPRGALALLLLHAGEPVSAERLAVALWGEDAPASAIKTVQVHVSRLRKALGEPERLVTRPAGYLLRLEADELDLARFERAVADGRAALEAGDAHRAATLLREALALWRGPALADVISLPFAQGEIARLDEQRLAALELRIEADLAAGRDDQLVVELQRLVVDHPLHERLHAQLMLALYRAGRQADALEAYRAAHRLLDDALGVTPGHDLRELHQAVLSHDPQLAVPAARRERLVERHNLPAARTSFVGRADELAAVLAAIERARLVTICGPGGAGKTRLALQAAHSMLDEAPDGVWLAALGGVSTPDAALDVAARTLRVRAADDESPVRALADGVRDRELLLILDNCEHVIDGASELADALLEQAPNVRVLATSREPLRVRGERVLRLGPLTAEDAVALFAQRAALVQDSFWLSPINEPVVHDICRRLDRLPLAIELAAAHSYEFDVKEIARRLEDGFTPSGVRGGEPRQRTLRATVDWSYQLLSDDQQTLLRQLAVFAGSFTPEAVQHICADPSLPDVGATLAALADRSLLATETLAGQYRLLETIRTYARDRLRESGDEPAITHRHAIWFATRTQHAIERLWGTESQHARPMLVADIDDIRRALEHCEPASEPAISLTAGLAAYARIWGGARETHTYIQRTLAALGQRPRIGPMAELLHWAVLYEQDIGAPERARELAAEGVKLCRELDDPGRLADALVTTGICERQSDPDHALRSLEEALDINRALRNQEGIAWTLNVLGELARERGDFGQAASHYEEGLAAAAALPGSTMTNLLGFNLGFCQLELGDLDGARTALTNAAHLARDEGEPYFLAVALSGLAGLFAAAGDHARCARILGAAARLLLDAGRPLEPVDGRASDRASATANAALGSEEFRELFEEGHDLPTAAAVELATGGNPEPETAAAPVPEHAPAADRVFVSDGGLSGEPPALARRRGDTAEPHERAHNAVTAGEPTQRVGRVLATVMFTDLVASTERAADLGDRRWIELLDQHEQMIRHLLQRHGGREIKTTGDGFLALFDGPGRAIRCATAAAEQVKELGVEIRAGLHAGECELRGDDVGGIAVHIGARILGQAGPGDVLVSHTVRDLTAGSDIKFSDRGERQLKGVPGEWRLYAVVR